MFNLLNFKNMFYSIMTVMLLQARYSLNGLLQETEDTLVGAVIANIASVIVGLLGIVLAVWGFIKRGQDNGSDNAIWKVGVGMIAVIILITIVRLFIGF